jgi:hypothetical protein
MVLDRREEAQKNLSPVDLILRIDTTTTSIEPVAPQSRSLRLRILVAPVESHTFKER